MSIRALNCDAFNFVSYCTSLSFVERSKKMALLNCEILRNNINYSKVYVFSKFMHVCKTGWDAHGENRLHEKWETKREEQRALGILLFYIVSISLSRRSARQNATITICKCNCLLNEVFPLASIKIVVFKEFAKVQCSKTKKRPALLTCVLRLLKFQNLLQFHMPPPFRDPNKLRLNLKERRATNSDR